MTEPIANLFGQLVMSGWIGVNPRDQRDMSFVYLGSPGGGALGLPAQEVMPMLAEALGLNPTPGALTEAPTADTHLRLGSFGAELRYPGGTSAPHPVSDEWRQVAARRGAVQPRDPAKHGVGRRTVVKALTSVWPEPRKPLPPRPTRLDAYKPVIDQILRDDLDARRKHPAPAAR